MRTVHRRFLSLFALTSAIPLSSAVAAARDDAPALRNIVVINL